MSTIISRDEVIDVDAIVKSYTKTKHKKLTLFFASALLFIGCTGGFVSLQVAHAKVDRSTSTAVEMAHLAQKSGYCDDHKEEPACLKAAALVANPDSVIDVVDKVSGHGPVVAAASVILQLQLNYGPLPKG